MFKILAALPLVVLAAAKPLDTCTAADIPTLAAKFQPGESFDCVDGNAVWDCLITTEGYKCTVEVKKQEGFLEKSKVPISTLKKKWLYDLIPNKNCKLVYQNGEITEFGDAANYKTSVLMLAEAENNHVFGGFSSETLVFEPLVQIIPPTEATNFLFSITNQLYLPHTKQGQVSAGQTWDVMTDVKGMCWASNGEWEELVLVHSLANGQQAWSYGGK